MASLSPPPPNNTQPGASLTPRKDGAFNNIMNLTTFTGIGTIIEHEGNSIIITAGSVAILKAYLGEQHAEEICNVGITVGPRAEIAPAIILDAIELK